MKTTLFLEDVSPEIRKDQIYNVSDVAAEKLIKLKVKLEFLTEDDKQTILPSDKIPFDKILYDKEHKIEVQLPQNDSDSNFAMNVAEALKGISTSLYWDPTMQKVVEVNEWIDAKSQRVIFGRRIVETQRLKAMLEQYLIFYNLIENDGEFEKRIKSPPEVLLKFLPSCDSFRNSLKVLNHISESPYVYVSNGKLTVANSGYNDECKVYVRADAPAISEMELLDSVQIINECLIDFPFEQEQDRVIAISAIITPMLRGIYGRPGIRTPVYAYLANQQGAGKDYLAGIRHLIYTGRFSEDAPLSTDKQSSSEEIQKEIITAAINGQTFMHFSNCRGHLANASFEKHTTAATIKGRILGGNTNIDIDNIFEFSYSGNYGLTFNRDIARRTVIVNLFTEVEDTTKRKFSKDLHHWIIENRSKILSAIYTIIKKWHDAGAAFGDGINSSYPLWAKYISGVMTYANLGDPCKPQATLAFDNGGDTETRNIVEFNREMGQWLEDPVNSISSFVTDHSKDGLTKKELFALYGQVFQDAEDKPFGQFDLNIPKDRREFGRLLNKFIGTIRGGYKLMISKPNEKLDRQKFKLVKSVPTVLSGLENISMETFEKNLKNNIEYKIGTYGTVGTDLTIMKMVQKGDLVEIKPNTYQKVV